MNFFDYPTYSRHCYETLPQKRYAYPQTIYLYPSQQCSPCYENDYYTDGYFGNTCYPNWERQAELRRAAEQRKRKQEIFEYLQHQQLLKQRHQERLRQQRLREEQEKLLYQERLLQHKQLMEERERRRQMYEQAATKIQKAFRAHLKQRQKKAVERIEKVYLQFREKKQFRETFGKSLLQLREIQNKFSNLSQHYLNELQIFDSPLDVTDEEQPRIAYSKSNYNFLQFEEVMLKLLMQLDSIETFQNDFIRQFRKSLVSEIQSLLTRLDSFKEKSISESQDFGLSQLFSE